MGRLWPGLQEQINMPSSYNEPKFMEFPIFIPWSNSWLLKNQAKCSITIAKRKEDNGQPRLAPWCHFKKGEFKLLVCTDLVRILQNIFNPIFMKVFLQWGVWGFGGVFLFHFHVLFLRTVTKYFHFNESKDLPSQSSGQIYILSKLLFGMQTQSIRISSSEEQWK